MRIDDTELLTAAEIAAELGVTPARVSGWLYRRQMPEPDVRLDRRRPLWRRETLEPWLAEMRAGRLAAMTARYRRA